MEDKKIIECNKLIAEFMEWRKDPTHGWLAKDEQDAWSYRDDYHFKYYVSWDWLMPVVEKIEKGNYGFKICRKVVEIYFDDSKEVILKTKEDCKFNSLYKAIVEFIKWKNQQLKEK